MTNVSRNRILVGALVVGLAAAAHLPAVWSAEMTGEDELLFNYVGRSILSVLQGNPDAWRDVLRFYYPPLQALLPTPMIALFGFSPWTLRIPGALSGMAAALLLFWMMDRSPGQDRRSALFAGVLAATGGVAANHHYALTCGIFSFGAALCAAGLAGFVDTSDEETADRWLLAGSVGIVWAMMTLPDGFFYLPVLALAYVYRRGRHLTRKAWVSLGLVLSWGIVYGVCWLWLPNSWQETAGGSTLKLQLLLSKLGAFRIHDLVLSFVAGSSWPMVAMAPVLLPLGWMAASRGLQWVVLFYAFPLFLWTFAFDYPNVRAAHMLLAFPGYALLWALGAVRIRDLAMARSIWMGFLASVVLVLAVLSAVWQTGMLHVGDILPEDRMGPRWLVLREYYPQGRRVEVLGQHAAGWWIRNHSVPELGVSSNLGGAFADYYAGRPYFAPDKLAEFARAPEASRLAGVRFYVHSLKAPTPRNIALEGLPIALEVHHRGKAVLRIYDLWQEQWSPSGLEAREGRRLWNLRYLESIR